MLKKKFNEENGLLTIRSEGDIDYWEVLNLYEFIENDNSLPRKLKVLIDTRNSKFDFDLKHYDDFSIAVENVMLKYDIIKEAIIVDSTYETAVAMMFEDKTMIENYSFKVFSTKEAALNWLFF